MQILTIFFQKRLEENLEENYPELRQNVQMTPKIPKMFKLTPQMQLLKKIENV